MSSNEIRTERSMIIFVNGQETQISNGHTAHDLLLDLGFETRPVAVEVNKEVIPRALLPSHVLCEHDQIEVVTLVGGG